LLSIPKHGAYNLHGSLLPAYRGRAPVNWVLVNGETSTGVTLHRMVKRPDAGEIDDQREVVIEPDETARSLHGKLNAVAAEMLAVTMPSLRDGKLELVPQEESVASYFGRRC